MYHIAILSFYIISGIVATVRTPVILQTSHPRARRLLLPKTFCYMIYCCFSIYFLFVISEQHAEQHMQQPEVSASGLSIIAVSNELIELKQKVNQLLQLITGSKAKSLSMHVTDSINIDMSDDDNNDKLNSSDDSYFITQQL